MQNYNTELSNFCSIVKTKVKVVEDIREYYGKELAMDFNSIDFWELDENKVSKIIAFFLDPCAAHQQGDIYLQHFLKLIRLSDLDSFKIIDFSKVCVECEHVTNKGRRIDILINYDNYKFAIGIENKININTADQDNQINDYIVYLQKRTHNNYHMVYLSPKDKLLAENSLQLKDKIEYEKDQVFKSLNYEEDLIECIHDFALMTANYRVKAFLLDFEGKLRKMYMGENRMDTKKTVSEYISENSGNLNLAFIIANSLEDVKKNLKIKFNTQLAEIGNELGLEVAVFQLTPTNWSEHSIIFEFESNYLAYGIKRLKVDAEKPRLAKIEDFISEQLNTSFKCYPWWALWQKFYENVVNSKEFYVDVMETGKAKKRALDFVKLINDNFNVEEYEGIKL